MTNSLQETVDAMCAPDRGILAADESSGTIKKRFDLIDTESTEESRCAYRTMLFTTDGLGDHISGTICFEETLGQSAPDGRPLPQVLIDQGIVPGIKVDKGLVDLALSPGDQVTQGLDGLAERLEGYYAQGARFTKWRSVYHIGTSSPEGANPGGAAYRANAEALARYAAISQAGGFVPIVEPEVLMDGDHTIDRCDEVTKAALDAVFESLAAHNVALAHMVLKPNMVVSGADCAEQAGVAEVAERTAKRLKESVPDGVPGIFFLSGGQGDVDATAHLGAMNADHGPLPWRLSFSYGRALQAPSLAAWRGQAENEAAGQAALAKRARLNGAASMGTYTSALEDEPAAV